MKQILSSKNHGVVDYVLAIVLLVCPPVMKLVGKGADSFYMFGAIYLLLALFTAHSLGVVKKVSFAIHGVIEFWLAVVVVLFGAFALRGSERLILAGVGVVSFISFLITDFSDLRDIQSALGKRLSSVGRGGDR